MGRPDGERYAFLAMYGSATLRFDALPDEVDGIVTDLRPTTPEPGRNGAPRSARSCGPDSWTAPTWIPPARRSSRAPSSTCA
jgi:hypothetical protein